ncbi:cytochrome P450 [Actinophytocola gossypii]|uniref:Cytochrome P450 n=1 Tax=Actinophytocola gossypii TaxID=2812003 RepID=A0ABT2J7R5_9PSEU|nr:cytochrome P450 [Actinophytocola gossypii]MCT2583751.1 cytochrome P450 [Actinophytocola gossypii]
MTAVDDPVDSVRAASGAIRVPPGPPRSATLKLLRQLKNDRLTLMSTAAAEYGDAVRVGIGPKTLYFFNHPDTAKHVLADNAANYDKGIGYQEAKRALGDGLLTSSGELWRKQRRTIQPVFQNKRITGLADVVAEEAERLVGRLRAGAGGVPVDLLTELTGFTLGVLGRTLLDADLGEFDSIGHSFEAVQDQAMFEMETMGLVPRWLPLSGQRRFRRARADLQRIVDKLVADRLAEPRPDGDDVLTRLIHSTSLERDPGVAATRMRDELITLLLAGHETTASSIGWTMHLIDEHPETGRRLHEEALEVLGDRLPTYADLSRLRFHTMVLQESMRLFPPVWILTRRALAEDTVGGYRVPAGADVLICPYTLHRHPSFWDRPDEFDPDRFDPDRPSARPRYAFLPFGAGPRFCVGNHLGLMEATFVLALLSRELRLTKVPGHDVVAEPMLSLRMRGELPMTVRKAN